MAAPARWSASNCSARSRALADRRFDLRGQLPPRALFGSVRAPYRPLAAVGSRRSASSCSAIRNSPKPNARPRTAQPVELRLVYRLRRCRSGWPGSPRPPSARYFGGLIANPHALGLDFLLPIYFLGLVMGFRKRPFWLPVVAGECGRFDACLQIRRIAVARLDRRRGRHRCLQRSRLLSIARRRKADEHHRLDRPCRRCRDLSDACRRPSACCRVSSASIRASRRASMRFQRRC